MTDDDRFLEVYDELRALARQRLAAGLGGHTLQATALVHEVWLKLASPIAQTLAARDPRHFYATAARAMRFILVDHARRKGALKRSGGASATGADPRDPDELPAPESAADGGEVLRLDAALEKLAAVDARKAEVVMLRHFAGLSVEEAAEALAISPATVKREWQFARAWLLREMGRETEGADGSRGRFLSDS